MCRIIQKRNTIENISTITDRGGTYKMTNNEMELLSVIRENDNPEQALLTAIDTIIGFLEQHESSQSQSSAYLQAPA